MPQAGAWPLAVSSSTSEHVPLPPPDLAKRELPLIRLDELSSYWYRCHKLNTSYSAVSYNFTPKGDRFNAPNGEYGVLYMGCDPHCSFIETYGSGMVGEMSELRSISESELSERCICKVELIEDARPLQLVNAATGYGLSRLRIDGRISTAKEREITRQWAMAFWKHPQRPDGIYYTACNDPSRQSVVIFNRAGDVFRPSCRQNILRDAQQLADILDYYDVAIDPDLGLQPGVYNHVMSSN